MNKIIKFNKPIKITACASVVGKKESSGPLKEKFDVRFLDDYFLQNTWEKAETALQKETLKTLFSKRGVKKEEVNIAFGADLCNQITSSNFTFRDYDIPFVGLYGACSSIVQSIITASCFLDSGHFENAVSIASSHFCTAERQFRTPLDYGGKRTPTAQWTVTGSGAFFLETKGEGAYITRAMVGQIVDLGVKDANNMGAAMAPAAAKTISDFFKTSGKKPDNYDAIFTGDLGKVGSSLLYDLLALEDIKLKNHKDCGMMIFDFNTQNVESGASGAGCSASVLAAEILPKIIKKEYKKVLFIATGALLSTTTTMQKESIPSIAHLVEISAERKE